MKRKLISIPLIVSSLPFICLAGEEFDLSWNSVDGGGAMHSSSDDLTLKISGTIGQPDASVMAGGTFRLTGGFWFELPPGDCNADGAISLHDYQVFIDCLQGPDVEVDNSCICLEEDYDSLIDLSSFAEIQNTFHEP